MFQFTLRTYRSNSINQLQTELRFPIITVADQCCTQLELVVAVAFADVTVAVGGRYGGHHCFNPCVQKNKQFFCTLKHHSTHMYIFTPLTRAQITMFSDGTRVFLKIQPPIPEIDISFYCNHLYPQGHPHLLSLCLIQLYSFMLSPLFIIIFFGRKIRVFLVENTVAMSS